MTMFTEGRLQAYERMIQDYGENHHFRCEDPEDNRHTEKNRTGTWRKGSMNASRKAGGRRGCVQS